MVAIQYNIFTFCNKCKLALSHVIVSLKQDGNIHRVKCNTCKAVHAFRDPALVRAKRRQAHKRRKDKAIPLSEIWLQGISDPNRKPIKYTISKNFHVGDVIEHSSFGPGVVHTIIDDNKIEVIFKTQTKHLAQNR